MAIFRGIGGSGDSSDNSYLQEVTAQANAAEASATSAANSLAAIQETEVTSASFDTSDGVLTLTKTGGATVTADLDGRFLTSYTETDPVFSAHASSGITATQISNWDTAYGWGNHASAGYLTSETSHADVLVDGDFASAGFMKTDGAGNYSIDTATYIGNTENLLVKTMYESNGDTNAFTNADHSKLDGIEANADVTDTANVTAAGAAMLASSPTFTGTITAPNVDISTTGTVTTNIATGTGGTSDTKTLNLGTGYGGSLVGLTTVNIGSQHTSCQNTVNIGSGVSTSNREDTINLKGNVTVDGETDFNNPVTFNSDASGSGVYDLIATFNAKDSASTFEEAGRIATLGQGYPPSRLVIGQGASGLTFYDFFGSRIIQPANVTTGNTSDSTVDLGGFAQRFNLGRFTSGTTTSSDRNEKRDIEELTEAELRVAERCKPLLRKYRRIDAYEEKGENARIHFGIIAQDLDDAFTAEGLDAHRYAMFMEDTWYELEEGGHTYTSLDEIPEDLRSTAVQKTRMGVRYEQLLAFIIAAI
jgi:hypothetical protein